MKYKRTKCEKQSGVSRVRHAEGLIAQLPSDHDGRNTWLLNYGTGEEAKRLRQERGISWIKKTQAGEPRIVIFDNAVITAKKGSSCSQP